MARIFLDTNTFIDINERRDPELLELLVNCSLYISVISIGIWAYIYKRTVPSPSFAKLADTFNLVDVTEDIATKSFLGPTNDFEDNVQLHSASEANCTVFIT